MKGPHQDGQSSSSDEACFDSSILGDLAAQFDETGTKASDRDASPWLKARALKPMSHQADLGFDTASEVVAMLLDFQCTNRWVGTARPECFMRIHGTPFSLKAAVMPAPPSGRCT
jgi:hypothetical protein